LFLLTKILIRNSNRNKKQFCIAWAVLHLLIILLALYPFLFVFLHYLITRELKMKRIFLALAAIIICATAAMGGEEYAQATFLKQSHDFGYIKEAKGPVSCTFELVNTGNKPLIIVEVTASCGCTRPQYSTKPIKPGKKSKIKVTYSPIGRPGAFRKTIKVKTNGREKHTTLTIEGTTIPVKY
jgi:hypothetical protein